MYRISKDKFMNAQELTLLRASTSSLQPRDALIIQLALATGGRAQEILNLTHTDISHDAQSVYIRGLKHSNDREIPLPYDLYTSLISFSRKDRERVFAISYDRLYQIWQGLKTNKKFHSLRHTFAIELYKKHRDIKLLQVALGHRNIANTMVYADYVFSVEELRRLIV